MGSRPASNAPRPPAPKPMGRHTHRMPVARTDLDWEAHVAFDPRYLRPAEVELLLGDASKAERKLGWKPETSFDTLVAMMVDHDMELAAQQKTLRDAGHAVPEFSDHDQ